MTFVGRARTAELPAVSSYQGFESGAFQKLDAEGVQVHYVHPYAI